MEKIHSNWNVATIRQQKLRWNNTRGSTGVLDSASKRFGNEGGIKTKTQWLTLI